MDFGIVGWFCGKEVGELVIMMVVGIVVVCEN